MGIGAVQSQAMFARAVATQLYAGDADDTIPGSLLNTRPTLQSLDAAQSTIVTQVGGASALRTGLADLDDAMTSVSTSPQRMAAGDTSTESVTALLDFMNKLNDTLHRQSSILSPRLRVTLDEIIKLTTDGLDGIGVTFDGGVNANLNETIVARALQNDPLAVADALTMPSPVQGALLSLLG